MKKKFAFVFGSAFLLRLVALNQSLWLDEAITAKVVRQFSLFQIPSLFSPTDFHPPLYYLFMKMWSGIFGMSEIALRFPSVLFSLLTGHILFLIATRYKNERFGLWVAALYLFNPLVIYYAQEARMYALVTFLLTWCLYFALEAGGFFPNPSPKNLKEMFNGFVRRLIGKRDDKHLAIIFFNLFMVLAIWTFYGSIFFILPLILFLWLLKKKKQALISLLVLFFSLLIQYPLISQQLQFAKNSLLSTPQWGLVLGQATLKNLFLIPVKFSIGRISFNPKVVFYILGGIWTLFVFAFVTLGKLRERKIEMLFALPLILAFLVSFFSPMLQYFRFLYLVPLMCLLIGIGVDNYILVKEKKGFWQLFTKKDSEKFLHKIKNYAVYEIIIGFFIFFSLVYLFNPSFHREDWKSLSASLPTGKSIYMILPSSDPLLYYRKTPLKELRNIGEEWLFEKDTYIIPYTSSIYGFDYEKALHSKGCYLKEKKVFREVYFEKWSCGYTS